MSNTQDVLNHKRFGNTGVPFLVDHWHFLIGGASIQEQADEFGLVGKAAGARVPAHNILSNVKDSAIVVLNIMAVEKIDEPGEKT